MPKVNTHTKTIEDGRKVDILKLVEDVRDRPLRTIKLDRIRRPTKSPRYGFSNKRYENTDIKYPLLIDENYRIIDGRHRYFKLLEKGDKECKVIIVTIDDLENCII